MDNNTENAEKPPVGNLTDFVEGVDENNPLDIEVSVTDEGKIIVFHNKKFKQEISWFEYNVEESKLDFIQDNGEIRNAGLPLAPGIAKYMHNAHQILMVLMNDESGQADEGHYIPLIVHKL